MVLQVHDELVFDVWRPETEQVRELVVDAMKSALPLDVPIEVEAGFGPNWLAAH
jgi:DNA polymerase-1